jgi:Flp pilus assembly protein TadB
MPEDIPKAVMILLWLLIGVIVFGYLVMAYPTWVGFAFAAVFYGIPVLIYQSRKKGREE